MDNAILGFDLMHKIRSCTEGKKGVCAFKLDMSKAYVRVDWLFLWEKGFLGWMDREGFELCHLDYVFSFG